MKDFLKNDTYPLQIARIAIVFQSIIAISISLSLITKSRDYITPLVWLDIVFIVAHLTYRALYSGAKIILTRSDKTILLVHVISSLGAIFLTLFLTTHEAGEELIHTTLLLWTTSLVFGLAFYFAKYTKKKRLLE